MKTKVHKPTKGRTSQQKAYKDVAKNIATITKRVEAVGRAAAKAEWEKIKAEGGNVAAEYDTNIRASTFKKRPPGFDKVLVAIADKLAVGGFKKTQKSILEEVAPSFPEHTLHLSLWSKDLPAWQLAKIQTRINGNMAKPVSIKGCKSLSQIKEKLKADTNKDAAEKIFHRTIVVTKDSIQIGRQIYPIQTVSSENGKYKYPSIRLTVEADGTTKRPWLRIAYLLSLMGQ